MDYKHLKAIGKRFLALMLSMVMVFSGTVTYAEPAESEKTDAIDDKALKEALEAESDTYPDGAFEFFLSQLEGTEQKHPLTLKPLAYLQPMGKTTPSQSTSRCLLREY